jgi:hypothetical protein
MKTHQQNDSKMMKGIKTQKNTKIGGPKSWFLKQGTKTSFFGK